MEAAVSFRWGRRRISRGDASALSWSQSSGQSKGATLTIQEVLRKIPRPGIQLRTWPGHHSNFPVTLRPCQPSVQTSNQSVLPSRKISYGERSRPIQHNRCRCGDTLTLPVDGNGSTTPRSLHSIPTVRQNNRHARFEAILASIRVRVSDDHNATVERVFDITRNRQPGDTLHRVRPCFQTRERLDDWDPQLSRMLAIRAPTLLTL